MNKGLNTRIAAGLIGLLILGANAAQGISFTPVAGQPQRTGNGSKLVAGNGAVYTLVSDRFYKTADGGATWTPLAGFPPKWPKNLAISGSSLFVATDFGVYRSTDDGASWQAFNGSGSGALSPLKINTVLASGGNVFATGTVTDANFNTVSYMLRSSADSASWSVDTPSSIGGDFITAMATAGSNACILAGNSAVRYSTDSGASWTGSSGISGNFSDIAVSPVDGSVYITGSSGGIRRSTNKCQSFTSVTGTGFPVMSGRTVSAIGVHAGGDLYVGLSDGSIYSSSDNGASFSAANSGTLPAATGVGFAGMVSGGGGLLAGTFGSGVHLKTTGNWQERNSGLKGALVIDMFGGAADGELVVGHGGGMLRSADGGATFNDINSGLDQRNIRAIGNIGSTWLAGTAASAGSGNAPALYRSTDSGASWTRLQAASGLPLGAAIGAVAHSGSVFLAALTAADDRTTMGLYRSTDDGLTWALVSAGGLPTGNSFGLRNMAVAANGHAFIYIGSSGIYRSADGGVTWALTTKPFASGLFGKVFAAGNTLIASANGVVYRSDDEGTTWTATTGFAISKFGIEILSLAKDAAGALYLGDEHAGLSISKDDGLTWAPSSDGLARTSVCIERINALVFKDGKIYAGQGEGGGIRVASPIGSATPADSVACTTNVDTFPNSFSFADKNGVPAAQYAVSNSITVAGLGQGVTVPVSVTGGEYSIGCSSYTSADGTVANGDQVCVRHMAPSVSETATTSTLTIADQSASFTSRTGLVFTGREDEINTTFNGGSAFATVPGTAAFASGTSDSLVLPDGRVVLAGTMGNGTTSQFVVAMLKADGTPDTSFGDNGIKTITIGVRDTLAAMVRQADGKLLLAGHSRDAQGSNGKVALVRLNADGSLDATFGTAGIATLDINPNDTTNPESVSDVAVLGDGSIVVAGWVRTSSQGDRFYVVKFTGAGAQITDFGVPSSTFSTPPKDHFIPGIGQVQVGSGTNSSGTLQVQSDGKLVVVGTAQPNQQNPKGLVVRFSAAGVPDATYGTGGVLTLVNPGGLGDALLMAGDKLLVAGNSGTFSTQTGYLALLKSDGTLDTTFGTAGERKFDSFGFKVSSLSRVIKLADGRLSVLGTASKPGDTVSSVLYAILNPNGSNVATFGPNGQGYVLRGPYNGRNIGTSSMTQRADGGVVVGASYAPSGNNQFAAYVYGGEGGTVTPPGPDTTPEPFSFTSQTNVGRSAVVTSASATITGIDAAAPVHVANGSYSIGCGNTYVTTDGSITNGQTVCLRQTASDAFNTSTTTTLTIGTVMGSFTSTTLGPDITPDAFSFTGKTGVQPGSTVESDAATITGINVPAEISVENGEYSIAGGNYTSASGTIMSGQAVRVRHTAAAADGASVTTTLTVGTVEAVFTSTTTPAQPPLADTTPDPFSFTAVTGQQPNTPVTSNAITVQGTNQAAPISVTGGQYRINGGAFTDAAGQVAPGATVEVRGNSGDLHSTVQVRLTIGTVNGVFNISTVDEIAGELNGAGTAGTVPDTASRTVTVSTSAGTIENLRRVTQPTDAPAGFSFPDGFFAFDVAGLPAGGSTQVTVTVPAGVRPSGYVKCINGVCSKLPDGKAVISGNTITLTLTDGDPLTDAGVAGDGKIVDPGAPAIAVSTKLPYGTGSMGLGTLLLPLMAALRRRRKRD